MGRPREFDADEALDKAMRLFWAKGYHDTSIRDLVERTGVNYYGLYGEFANKQGLFLASLDRYRGTVTAELIRNLNRSGPLVPSLKRAFERLLGLMQGPDGRIGCLMCNAAVEVAPYDEEVAERVKAHRELLTEAFKGRLIKAQANGELPKNKDVEALAAFLTTTAYSAGLLLRSGSSDADLRQHVRTALSVLE